MKIISKLCLRGSKLIQEGFAQTAALGVLVPAVCQSKPRFRKHRFSEQVKFTAEIVPYLVQATGARTRSRPQFSKANLGLGSTVFRDFKATFRPGELHFGGLGHPWAPFWRPWVPRPILHLYFWHLFGDFASLGASKGVPRVSRGAQRRPKLCQK